MVDPRHTPEAGFTLAEMLAALAILLFGVTALLGGLTTSVGLRRTADARLELCAACDYAMHRVQHEAIVSPTGGGLPNELEFKPLLDQPTPGFPGLTWSAKATTDETRPFLWLVTLTFRWFDASEEITTEFLRVLPRQLPLRERVRAFRNEGEASR
ncbi:MAG: prepilin-type N-terminal cleavage/methylation domain-containing protein [Planctomycetes bacterium]|nr:prepilin-type N-terminal cleavage/methylation domain-containing protein [Planctomycetota bacterium]